MNKPLIQNRDYYYNKEGLMVMTAAYHLQRGHCCGNGCLHCPYEYENVAEPRKSELLAQRREDSQ